MQSKSREIVTMRGMRLLCLLMALGAKPTAAQVSDSMAAIWMANGLAVGLLPEVIPQLQVVGLTPDRDSYEPSVFEKMPTQAVTLDTLGQEILHLLSNTKTLDALDETFPNSAYGMVRPCRDSTSVASLRSWHHWRSWTLGQLYSALTTLSNDRFAKPADWVDQFVEKGMYLTRRIMEIMCERISMEKKGKLKCKVSPDNSNTWALSTIRLSHVLATIRVNGRPLVSLEKEFAKLYKRAPADLQRLMSADGVWQTWDLCSTFDLTTITDSLPQDLRCLVREFAQLVQLSSRVPSEDSDTDHYHFLRNLLGLPPAILDPLGLSPEASGGVPQTYIRTLFCLSLPLDTLFQH